jgi:hypothetical protein
LRIYRMMRSLEPSVTQPYTAPSFPLVSLTPLPRPFTPLSQVLFEDIQDDAISLEGLAEYWLGFSEAVRDPTMIFQAAWRCLAALVDGEQNIRMPHEIMFLGGAPGAGKGTMTPYVMWERGITAKPIVMSAVLNSPSAQKIITAGGLVGDMEVRIQEGRDTLRDVGAGHHGEADCHVCGAELTLGAEDHHSGRVSRGYGGENTVGGGHPT